MMPVIASPAGVVAGRRDWAVTLGALALVALALGVAFAPDWAAMATTWWDSSTYQHCLIMVPVIGWLVWIRRPSLARVAPRAWWPPLVIVAGGGVAWLVGVAADLAVIRQGALVAMADGAVMALVGPAASRILAFPLGYALLLVPMGEELVPTLQTLTARMTMVLLHLSGIAARIDGIFITTPAGYFKVAEACSGVKFLVAMIALGVLIAHLSFARWGRRFLFLVACVVVPVLANGIRAYATIAIAQRLGIGFAAGFDHVVYGWFFFALVIALLIGGAWRWFDRDPLYVPAPVDGVADGGAMARYALILVLLGTIVGVRLMLPDGGGVAAAGPVAPPALSGWRLVADFAPTWRPVERGAGQMALWHYQDASGVRVDLAYAAFARVHPGPASWGNGAAGGGNGWVWAAGRGRIGACALDQIEAPGPRRRLALTCLDVGGRVVGTRPAAKLAAVAAVLTGRLDRGQRAWIATTPLSADAAGVLRRFAMQLFAARSALAGAGGH